MTVVLETERLFLRELLLNDVEPLGAVLANPEITKHIGGPRDQGTVRQWIQEQQRNYQEHGFGYWAVIQRESATFVGQAGVFGSPPELGCVLDEPYWRHGLAKEILGAVRDHAFTHLGLDHLSATVQPNHKAGNKLAVALEMQLEGDEDELVYRIHKEAG